MKKPLRVTLLASLAAGVVATGALQLVPASATSHAAPPRPPAPLTQPATGKGADRGSGQVESAAQPPRISNSDAGATVVGSSQQHAPLSVDPALADHTANTTNGGQGASLAASCTPADFGSRTGSALTGFVKASTVSCVNTLFSLTGTDARNVFREAQMVTIANALRDTSYPGNNSTSVEQLLLFLRAGYFVQFYHPADVGTYGPTLKAANRSALDNFFASAHSRDVSDSNGEVLGEAVIQIDSSNESARYLYVVRRLLLAFDSRYNASWYMRNAVNNVFTVLFRGHQNADFNAAVVTDPSIVDVVYNFTKANLGLLGTDSSFVVANAGGETTRFLANAPLQAKVRPLAKSLLGVSSITGPTAPLWVRVADVASYHDTANCAYYDICNLEARLAAAALPITYNCDAGHTIRAQAMTSAELTAACTSVRSQDAYFHNIVKDSGPVANDHNTNIQIVVFGSPSDYQTYSGVIFGNSTNNGGEYLEGNPADPNNQARFLAYQNDFDNGFPARIWNLNHEYTHYLDGRYDTYGDFEAGQAVPDIWWIEGLAEYISYSYRGLPDTRALAQAPLHTYALSTLWQTTYDNSNLDRTYQWGYLAARYMIEKHPADVQNMLAKFRLGDYRGGYAVYSTGIGTRYDADFNGWLDSLSGTGPGVPECTGADTRALGQNCKRSNVSATTGNVAYLFVYLPAGVSTLTVTSSDGTGNADLYYNATTWATPSNYTARSANAGNAESLTVSNPAAGYRYISLYATASFSGVTVTTTY